MRSHTTHVNKIVMCERDGERKKTGEREKERERERERDTHREREIGRERERNYEREREREIGREREGEKLGQLEGERKMENYNMEQLNHTLTFS